MTSHGDNYIAWDCIEKRHLIFIIIIAIVGAVVVVGVILAVSVYGNIRHSLAEQFVLLSLEISRSFIALSISDEGLILSVLLDKVWTLIWFILFYAAISEWVA